MIAGLTEILAWISQRNRTIQRMAQDLDPDKATPARVTHVPLQFYARLEQDGTYSLCLDPTASAAPPFVLGRGYDSPETVVKVLVDALTAPAVAEDRLAAVEEYLPALNGAIDAVNEAGEGLTILNDRIRELEAFRTEMERAGYTAPTRPAVPRTIPRVDRPQPPAGLRRPSTPVTYEEEPRTPAPAGRSIVGPSALDDPRPDFNRGEFKPHSPVGRVGRGPGSVG